jgi:Na+/proline symporter
MVLIAMYARRRLDTSTADGFFVANRRASGPFVAASFMATFMWGADLLSVPQTVYLTGISGIWMYGLPIVIGGFAIIPIASRLRSVLPDAMTYQEFFYERLDAKNHLLFTGIGIYTMLLAAALQLRAAGQIIGGLASIEPLLVAAIVATIVFVYSVLTGIWASLSTDLVQVVTTVVLTLVFVPYMVLEAGGIGATYDGLVANTDPSVMLSFSSPGWDTVSAYFLPFLLGWALWGVASMSVWQRAIAVRRDKMSRTFIYGSIGWFSTIPMYGIVGLLALAFAPDLASPGDAGVEVYTSLLGGVAAAVFIATLMGLVLSTIDSAILGLSLLATRDVYGKYLNPSADSERTVTVARFAIGVFTVLAFATTYVIWNVDFLTLIWINSIGITAVFFPLLYCLYWEQTSANSVFVTAVVVIAALVYMLSANYTIPVTYLVGHTIALLLTPALSYVWPSSFTFSQLTSVEANP